jgi:hypothetical protein
VFVYPRFEKGLTMRNVSWICMLIALAMFTVGCDTGPKPATPSGVDEAPTTMDVETPMEETGTEPATDAPTEPAPEPAADAPMEPATEVPATEPAPEEPTTEPAPE